MFKGQTHKLRNVYKLLVLAMVFSLSGNQAFAIENSVGISRSEAVTSRSETISISQNSRIDNNRDKSFSLAHEHALEELIIKFTDDTPEDVKLAALEVLAVETLDASNRNFTKLKINLSDIRLPRSLRDSRQLNEVTENLDDQLGLGEVIEALNSLSYIEYAEPNYIVHALASTPNDPYYNLQWNFDLIGVSDAWDESQGEGVVVAIVDTGVAYEKWRQYYQAPDLRETNFVKGYNTANNSKHANDDNGHGTHIAGTIAGSTNNREGVAGIAYKTSIMPVKALDRSGSGGHSDIAEGIYWAVDNGADIINLSLGGSVGSNVMRDAVRYAHNHNVLVVAAAGNDGNGKVLYPAAYNEYVLAVGAVRYDKQKSPYSSYGASLDLVAPGGDTKVDQNNDGYPDGILQQTLAQKRWGADTRNFSYYFYQGTSMAAPHVVAVAALVKEIGIAEVADIKQILLDSAEDINITGWDLQTGHGLVRADKAVEMALEQLTANSEQQTEINNNIEEITETQTQETPYPEPEAKPDPKPEEEASPEPEEEPEADPAPEEEEPVVEPEPEPEFKDMLLDVATYNMWGREDASFSFWEKAILKVLVEDEKQGLEGTELNIEVLNSSSKVVARGNGKTDSDGELWLELGNFTRGSYNIVVSAVKDGFNEVVDSVKFSFR